MAAAPDPAALAARLVDAGVAGVTVSWADNNGIPRSRTVPTARLADAAARGIGITTLFAVFDSHDVITYAHEGLSTASGDVRLVPQLERCVPLAGQPGLAWAPGRVVDADGADWPYDQRTALERQVARAAALGLEVRAGFELEFFVGHDARGEGDLQPAHGGPAYGPSAIQQLDGFAVRLLEDLAANGLVVGQLHAEYGLSQLEVALPVADPVRAADDQLLARETIRAAARAHGLKASFAPVVDLAAAGNGWHLHSSVARDGVNLLAGGDGPGGLTAEGASWVAGLLRDLPALAAVTAPSVPSLLRLRPGFFAGAYAFWGVQNREAPLRLVPAGALTGPDAANVELKACDASANPHLALAAVLAAGLAGIEEGLELPAGFEEDPGTWDEATREQRGVRPLPSTPADAEAALLASPRVTGALGDELLGAFLAVRRADAAWADGKHQGVVVASHRWLY